MWEFLQGSRWRSACLFAISGGIRSNGILHGGFLLFEAMHRTFKVLQHQQLKVSFCFWPSPSFLMHPARWYITDTFMVSKMAGKFLCIVTMQTILVFVPFVAFQTFGFSKLCYETSQPGIKDSRPWCRKRIPYLYGFVQSHYWWDKSTSTTFALVLESVVPTSDFLYKTGVSDS